MGKLNCFGVSFRHTLILVIILFFGIISIRAQTLNGKVIDAKTQDPIIGAVVRIKGLKGSGGGTVTDINGNFNLEITKIPTTIVASYTGYRNEEIEIHDVTDKMLQINLKENVNSLDEVVVVGYGTQNRTQITGSVSTVNSDVFDKSQSATLEDALGGQVAGLNVTSVSGQPGAASIIRIRGGNSVNANNDPLYVIDGFIYYKDASDTKTGLGQIESSLDPLASINPSDIESIEVLKDVSATAIYGSRGANGVILVTTKKGSLGKTNINYRYTAGFDVKEKKLDLLNATQWARLEKDYFNNKGGYTDEEIAALGEGTDWQGAVLRTAFRQSHELSITGGSEKSRYAFSVSYTNQDGIVINSGFQRYNFHVNADHNILPGLKMGYSISAGKSTQEGLTTTESVNYNSSPYSAGITNSVVYALFMPSVVTVYNQDGSYNYSNPYEYAYFSVGNKAANPVSDLENSVAESINNYLIANNYIEYKINHFTAKASLGLNREHVTQNYFSPSYTALGLSVEGIGGIGHKNHEIWQQEYTLNYTNIFNQIHFLNALLGYTYQKSNVAYNNIVASHFTNETLKYNNLADASDIYPPVSGSSESTLKSLISRVDYTYLNRYNVTATFRADNSSRFSAKHRWGYFPSIGFAWNVDREAFLKDNQIINSLKVRLSAGTVGNQEIGDYEYALTYTAGQYNGTSSYTKTNLGNDDLKWETTASYNFGLDAELFKKRLSFIMDLYYKKTSDLLLEVPVGLSSGVSTQLENIGNVTNQGIEFTVNAVLAQKHDFYWTVNANIAHNKNKITDMGSNGDIIEGDYNEVILRKGQSLGTFYGLKFKGVSNNMITYEDVDNNGIINSKDRQILGSIQPKFIYGFGSSVKFKRVDASVHFQGSEGNKLCNALRYNLEHANDSYNVLSTYYTASRTSSYMDSRYIEDASYLKLKNITIGYTFYPPKIPVSLRLFITASNIFTITKYKGYDPEVASGTDNGAYPASRSFIFGVDVKL